MRAMESAIEPASLIALVGAYADAAAAPDGGAGGGDRKSVV